MDNKIEGFRVGEYLIAFPPGDFVQEDENGEMFLLVDIYKIDNVTGESTKINKDGMPPELEEQINEELNKILLAAIEMEENKNATV
jgi:hypothetical protein